MKAYCISIFAITTLILTAVIITMMDSCLAIKDPTTNMKGSAFKKYSSFEYYKQEEQKDLKSDNSKNSADKTITEEEWKKRWTMYKELSTAEIVHSEKISLYHSEKNTFIAFTILFAIHLFLYRKYVKP